MARSLMLPARGMVWRMAAVAGLALALLGLAAALPGPAGAVACVVNSTADGGGGTLREKVNDPTCDSITFTLSNPSTITLTTGELLINRTLTITGPGAAALTISGNDASRVFNVTGGTVIISDLTIAHGKTTGGGGGAAAGTPGSLALTRVVVRDSTSVDGGGVQVNSAALTVTDSTISGNTATAFNGGGVSVGGTGAVLTVSGSTLSGNSAPSTVGQFGSGGGIAFYSDGTATITNSTIVNNSARLGAGAMIGQGGSNVSLTHVTISGNTGGLAGHTLLEAWLGATIHVKASVIANPGSNCGAFFNSTIVNDGYNVDDGTTCGFGTANGSVSGVNPLLAALGSYGGPTQTMALLPGSPAIDRMPGTGAGCLATDQRGITRPQPTGGMCDSGAFESRGFDMGSFGGDGQSAVVNTAFPLFLVAGFSSRFDEPIVGGVVAYTGPASGAGIQGSPLTATIAANGRAAAPVTANGTAGGPYTVVAVTAGAAGSESYSLTNLPAPTTLVADDATGVYTGTVTLRATLTATSGGAGLAGKTIAFTLNGSPAGTAVTDGSGVATLNNVSLAGINAGSYPTGVGASFAGDAAAAAADTAALTVSKAATALTQVRGDATYGDPTGVLTATLRRTNGDGGPVVGATVQFTINGVPAGSMTTNAQGVATLTGAAIPAGLNAGNYANAVGASFAGDGNHLATSASGPLKVARKILWVKPTDRTVGLKQPNPPTTPPAGCVAQQTPASACWLELTNGSSFVNGDDWGDLDYTFLRFQYARNPPSTNSTEKVGSKYRITAFGVNAANYDIRYEAGTMTVVAAP